MSDDAFKTSYFSFCCCEKLCGKYIFSIALMKLISRHLFSKHYIYSTVIFDKQKLNDFGIEQNSDLIRRQYFSRHQTGFVPGQKKP